MRYAVLARIEVSDAGLTLVLEDATDAGKTWRVDELFTAKNFASEEFLNVNLAPSEYEDIGMNVVGRLAALYQVRVASKNERGPE